MPLAACICSGVGPGIAAVAAPAGYVDVILLRDRGDSFAHLLGPGRVRGRAADQGDEIVDGAAMIAGGVLEGGEIVARLGIVRIDRERASEEGGRFLRRSAMRTALQQHRLAGLGQIVGVARRKLGGAAEGLLRLLEIADRAEGHAEPLPALVIVRIALQLLAQLSDHVRHVGGRIGGDRIRRGFVAGADIAVRRGAAGLVGGDCDRDDGEQAGKAEGDRGQADPARGSGFVGHSGGDHYGKNPNVKSGVSLQSC